MTPVHVKKIQKSFDDHSYQVTKSLLNHYMSRYDIDPNAIAQIAKLYQKHSDIEAAK